MMLVHVHAGLDSGGKWACRDHLTWTQPSQWWVYNAQTVRMFTQHSLIHLYGKHIIYGIEAYRVYLNMRYIILRFVYVKRTLSFFVVIL